MFQCFEYIHIYIHPSILLSKVFIYVCPAGSGCQFIMLISAVKCVCSQMSLLSVCRCECVCVCVSRSGSVVPAQPQSSFTGPRLSAETPSCLPAVEPTIHRPPGKMGFVQHLCRFGLLLWSICLSYLVCLFKLLLWYPFHIFLLSCSRLSISSFSPFVLIHMFLCLCREHVI